jgi:hypothetical protein
MCSYTVSDAAQLVVEGRQQFSCETSNFGRRRTFCQAVECIIG